jgi:hypothetical protein
VHIVEDPTLDPREFLDRLKAEHRVFYWEPLPPDNPIQFDEADRTSIRSSLGYLHQHWALPDAFPPEEAGSRLRGKLLGVFGRLTYRVLGRYLREERDLFAHLVRVNEALQQRCDELSLRCQRLNEDMLQRQTAEAANQAKLAVWLHLEPPANATTDAGNNGWS